MTMTLDYPRIVRPTSRRTPFAALVVPIDIKRQYTDHQITDIVAAEFMEDGGKAYVYVEFGDGTYDEWELPFQSNYYWQSWAGWRRSDSGLVE